MNHVPGGSWKTKCPQLDYHTVPRLRLKIITVAAYYEPRLLDFFPTLVSTTFVPNISS